MLKKKFLVGILLTVLVLPFAPVSQSSAASGLLTAILCPGSNAVVFYGSASNAPKEGAKSRLVEEIYDLSPGNGWDGNTQVEISLGMNSDCGLFDFNAFPQSGVVTQSLLDQVEADSGYEGAGHPYAELGVKVGSTRYSIISSTSSFFNNSPALFIVDYGTGGGMLSTGDGYSSDGSFLSRIYPTSLPQISTSDGKVLCSAGQYRLENLNEGSKVSNATYRLSLHSESGELVTTFGTSDSASFDAALLPKKAMIWCEVEVTAANRVTLSKSIDDIQVMNDLKFEKKLKLRAVKLSIMKREVVDPVTALEKVETEFLGKLVEKKFAVVLP